MHVIAVLNQKCGAGNTTIATHLARAIQLTGADVLLVDSGPQRSARDWVAVCDGDPVPVISIDRPTIERDFRSVARKDYVIIDGALKAAFVVSRAIKVTRIEEKATNSLAGYDLPALDVRITQRVIYPSSVATGTTVLDQAPGSDVAKEIQVLADAVLQFLD